MNELARRYGSGGFPYGTTEDKSAFEEFARVMANAARAMEKNHGGHANFLAYLNGVQPSRNVEIAPYDPYYNPNNEPHMGFSAEEQAQYEREYDDEQNANPLHKPERDPDGELLSWMANLFGKRAPR